MALGKDVTMYIKLVGALLILAGCGSDAYVKRGTTFVEFATDGERVQEYLNNK